MNTDIRLNTTFYENPKIVELLECLGADGVLCLMILWCIAAKIRPEGVFRNMSNKRMARLARWSGCPDEFVDTLVTCGLLDRDDEGALWIHDWEDHNEYASKASARKEAAKIAARKKWAKKCGEYDPTKDDPDPPKSKNVGSDKKNVARQNENVGSDKNFGGSVSGDLSGCVGSDKTKNAPDKTEMSRDKTRDTNSNPTRQSEEKQEYVIDVQEFMRLTGSRIKSSDAVSGESQKSFCAPSPAPSPSPVRIKDKDTPLPPCGGEHVFEEQKIGERGFAEIAFNALAGKCPDICGEMDLSNGSTLRKQFRSRCKERAARRKLSWWVEYWDMVAASDWLMGRKGEWSADPLWLTKRGNMEKVLSGSYRNRGNARASPATGRIPVSKNFGETDLGEIGRMMADQKGQ